MNPIDQTMQLLTKETTRLASEIFGEADHVGLCLAGADLLMRELVSMPDADSWVAVVSLLAPIMNALVVHPQTQRHMDRIKPECKYLFTGIPARGPSSLDPQELKGMDHTSKLAAHRLWGDVKSKGPMLFGAMVAMMTPQAFPDWAEKPDEWLWTVHTMFGMLVLQMGELGLIEGLSEQYELFAPRYYGAMRSAMLKLANGGA